MEISPIKNRYHLRLATLADVPQLRLLIDTSVRTLHAKYYTLVQISEALKSVYGVDTQLINDGNYFVIEIEPPSLCTDSNSTTKPPSKIIACGGWSKRSTLYGGDQFASRNDNLLNPETDAAKIRAFFVHPDWTRRGVGGIVLRACEDAAREAGFKRAEMGATLSGVPFYGRMGYKEIDVGLVKVPIGDSVVLEIVRMGKSLFERCCSDHSN